MDVVREESDHAGIETSSVLRACVLRTPNLGHADCTCGEVSMWQRREGSVFFLVFLYFFEIKDNGHSRRVLVAFLVTRALHVTVAVALASDVVFDRYTPLDAHFRRRIDRTGNEKCTSIV